MIIKCNKQNMFININIINMNLKRTRLQGKKATKSCSYVDSRPASIARLCLLPQPLDLCSRWELMLFLVYDEFLLQTVKCSLCSILPPSLRPVCFFVVLESKSESVVLSVGFSLVYHREVLLGIINGVSNQFFLECLFLTSFFSSKSLI